MLWNKRDCFYAESINSIRKFVDPMTASKLLARYTQWGNKLYSLTNVIQFLFNFI